MPNNKLLIGLGVAALAYIWYKKTHPSQPAIPGMSLPQGTVPSTLVNPTNIPQGGTIAVPSVTIPAHLQNWIGRYLQGYPSLTNAMNNAVASLSQGDINMFDSVATSFDNGVALTPVQNAWWDNFTASNGLT